MSIVPNSFKIFASYLLETNGRDFKGNRVGRVTVRVPKKINDVVNQLVKRYNLWCGSANAIGDVFTIYATSGSLDMFSVICKMLKKIDAIATFQDSLGCDFIQLPAKDGIGTYDLLQAYCEIKQGAKLDDILQDDLKDTVMETDEIKEEKPEANLSIEKPDTK